MEIEEVVNELASGFPWFLERPEDIGPAYLTEDYLVLDLETTTYSFGDATDERNEVVCAAWYRKGAKKVEYRYGPGCLEDLLCEIDEVLDNGGFLVGHNIKFDLKHLYKWGQLDPYGVLVYDTMLGEHIKRGNRLQFKVNLNDTAQRYGCTAKAYMVDRMLKGGVDTKFHPKPLLKARVIKDVKDTTRTFLRQRESLNEAGQLGIMGTRCLFTPVLADIEMKGIPLNADRVKAEHNKLLKEKFLLEQKWNVLYGEVNPKSTQDMAFLIYDQLKFKELTDYKGKKIRNKPNKNFPTGAPKVDEKTLGKLEVTSSRQRQFLEIKKELGRVNTRLSKTMDFFKGICEEEGGIFYGQFNQAVTQTHRLSSSSIRYKFKEQKKELGVQLQNLPREYKKLVGPGIIAETDGSQLEFRVAAFLGQDKQAISDIIRGVDRHKQTAMQLYGISEEEVTPEIRQASKEETFKPLYGGMRGTEQQERYYKWFRKQFPDLAETQTGWTLEVLANDTLRMPWGMQWYWPNTRQSKSGYIDNTPSIYNYPVQSLATAEIIPIAAVYLWYLCESAAQGIHIFNTVHDSVIASIPNEETIPLWQEMSIQAFTKHVYNYLEKVYGMKFNVPLGVGVTVGEHWGEKQYLDYEINVHRNGERFLPK